MSTQELQLAILHRVTSQLGDVGKIRLQKLAYFLQEAMEVPTKFSFRMHHYGPYAEDLERDTAWLKFAGYINIASDPEGYGFHITPTDGPREEWKTMLHHHEESIELAVDIFGDRSISELELAATIHYMRRLRPKLDTDELLNVVRDLKPRFSVGYVSAIHAELKQLNLLD